MSKNYKTITELEMEAVQGNSGLNWNGIERMENSPCHTRISCMMENVQDYIGIIAAMQMLGLDVSEYMNDLQSEFGTELAETELRKSGFFCILGQYLF